VLKVSVTFLAAVALIVGVAACGSTVVEQSSEVHLMDKVLQSKGAHAKSVDCPSDTDAKAGTTFSCTAELTTGQTVTMDAKVTSVDGDTVHMQATGLHVTKGG